MPARSAQLTLVERGHVERAVAAGKARSARGTARSPRSTASPSVVLPEPLSPTSPSVSPRPIESDDVVHRADQPRRAATRGRRCASGSARERCRRPQSSGSRHAGEPRRVAVDAGDRMRAARGNPAAAPPSSAAARRPGSADGSGSRSAPRRCWAWSRRSAGCGAGDRCRRAAAPLRAARACRDAPGARKMSRTGPLSTMRPEYMIATRSAICATMPRSWVMNRIAMPSSRFSARSRSRICAWMVTSSAVVGSSAISRLGPQIERARDHRALAHAAGEFRRIAVERADADRACRPWRAGRRRGPARSPRARLARAPARPRRSARRWCGPARTSSSAPGRSSPCARPRIDSIALPFAPSAAMSPRKPSRACSRIRPPAIDRPALEQLHQRQRGHALARAAFADERQHLAAADREGDVLDDAESSRRPASSAIDRSLDARAPSVDRAGAHRYLE